MKEQETRCPECGSDDVYGDVNGEPDRFDFICGFCAFEWNKEEEEAVAG